MVDLSSAAAAAASAGTTSHSSASSSATASLEEGASRPRLPVPPTRNVARPITNLGNTCYMNAVLQALAHAPELCLAMDCDPHHLHCPVAQENLRRRQASSRSSSPDTHHSNNSGTYASENDFHRKPPRKLLRRSSRKSPTNGMSANSTEGSPGGNDMSSNTINNALETSSDDGGHLYCALCEMEWHLQEVHSTAAIYNNTTNNNANAKDTAVEPQMFANGFIHHVAPHFKMGNQEDSHEFLRLLIDAMQHSAKNARPSKKSKKRRKLLLEDEDSSDNNQEKDDDAEVESRMDQDRSPGSTRSTRSTSLTVSSPGKDRSKSPTTNTKTSPHKTHNKNSNSSAFEDDTEYPFQLFRGTVESCVTCDSCKATSSTLDPIEDVGLEVTPPSPLPTSSRSNPSAAEALADVSSAFRRFARVEDLDSGYKCESCGKGGRATKQSRLASIPPILTLHLKRFRYGGDARGPSPAAAAGGFNRRTTKSGSAKIEGHIEFEQIFDLKPYLTDKLQAKRKAMFCRLFAVVVHAGKNSHSGHYIAYVRNIERNEWWKMDDARVTKVDMLEVLQAEAYMLFYRVVDHPFALHLKEKAKKLQEEWEAIAKAERLAAEARAVAAAAAAEVDSKTVSRVDAEKENVPTPSSSPKEGSAAAAADGESSDTASGPPTKTNATVDKVTKQGPSTRSATKAASAASPGSNGKKRTFPDYLDGKSWAKAKTRLKPEHYKSLLNAEEYVNEHVQLKPDFFKLITEEGSKEDAKVGKCPIKLIGG